MPKVTKMEPIWFDWPADEFTFDPKEEYEVDPYGGRICLNHLEFGDEQRIIEKARPMKAVYDGVSGVPQYKSEFSKQTDNEETSVKMVLAWEKFFDGKSKEGKPYGEELECNEENKRAEAQGLAYMVALFKFRKRMRDIYLEKKEEELKNLKTTPNG